MAPGWGNDRLRIKLKNCNVWRVLIIESHTTLTTESPQQSLQAEQRKSRREVEMTLITNRKIKVIIESS